jgi:predicted O-methyltransferase YrrM
VPGIQLNTEAQLAILESFAFFEELSRFPFEAPTGKTHRSFYYHNGAYGPGDAEYLYSMIRKFKPARFIEVGSGFSTLIAREAMAMNQKCDPGYRCEVTCIEPYEQPWLEDLGVTVVRRPVETTGSDLFATLGPNDILFIDSSHVIRPQGDVLYLYQEVLPLLRPGVFVHIHDVFTPKDYLDKWILDDVRLWNEQYLLEAFLTYNGQFRVTGALNYLAHHHRSELMEKCPAFAAEANKREPGAFWIQRN